MLRGEVCLPPNRNVPDGLLPAQNQFPTTLNSSFASLPSRSTLILTVIRKSFGLRIEFWRSTADRRALCSENDGVHDTTSVGERIFGSVFDCNSCRETPVASSTNCKPLQVTSRTQRSVITRSTTRVPVSGSEQD